MNQERREAWLRDRQRGIGSSDAPCIMNVGYRSASDVYRDKTEPVDARAPSGILRRGIEMEPIVAALYTEATGEELREAPEIQFSRETKWQFASLDRVRLRDGRPVELKTVYAFGDSWGLSGSADIPTAYEVQCQHQMGVVGADWCDLAALDVMTWELRVYRVPFDPALFAEITEREQEFWRHVESRRPLPPEWAETSPIVVKGKCIDLGEEAAELAERRRRLQEIEIEARVEREKLTASLEELLGDAERAVAGGWTIKRVNVKETRVEAHERAASTYIRCERTKRGTP